MARKMTWAAVSKDRYGSGPNSRCRVSPICPAGIVSGLGRHHHHSHLWARGSSGQKFIEFEHGGHTQTYHDFDAPWWFGSSFNEVGHSRPTHPLVQAWARETFGTEGRRVLLLNCREDLMTCGEESRDSLEYASKGPSSMTDELLGDLQTTFLLQMLWMFCMGQALMTTSTGSNMIE